MTTEFSIYGDKSYQEIMIAIYEVMNKGEANLAAEELDKLQRLALAAEKYENKKLAG